MLAPAPGDAPIAVAPTVPGAIASESRGQEPPTVSTSNHVKRSRVSNLGALTTTFTPPRDCSTLLVRTIHSADDDDNYTQFYAGYGETCTVDDEGSAATFVPASCYPGKLADWFNNPSSNLRDTVEPAAYSPGLVCPAGYEPACSLTRREGALTTRSSSESDLHDLWDMLKDDETAIGCCPTGFFCKSATYSVCESTLTAPMTITAVSYNSVCVASTLRTHIPLAWAAFMDSQFAEAPRIILILPNETTTIIKMTSATPDVGGNNDQGGSDTRFELSSGVKIAIAVVVSVIVTLIVAALFWFIRRRRTNRPHMQESQSQGADPTTSGQDTAVSKPELQGSALGATELPGVASQTPELDNSGTGPVAELDGGNRVWELDSNSVEPYSS